MDRQAWIAVICCVVGLVAWQYYYTTKYPVPVPPPAASPTPGSPAPAASPVVTNGQPTVVTDRQAPEPTPAPSAEPAVPEQIETVSTPQIDVRFTNLGGGIAEAELHGKEHLAERVNGKDEYITLNHAGHIPIGALSTQPGENTRLPYVGTHQGNVVRYERTDPATGLKITKEYTLDYQGNDKQIPAVSLKVTFTAGPQGYHADGYYIHAGSSAPIHRRDLGTYLSFDWFSDGHYHTDHATSFDPGRIPLIGYETHPGRNVITNGIDKAAWVAVKNQFYVTTVAPIPALVGEEPAAREVWAHRFDLPRTEEEIARNEAVLHGIDVALEMPALTLKPGETLAQTFQIYTGPKYYTRLDKLGHNEQEVMDFGKFKVVSILLLGLMNTFHGWFGSYALAIVLLTILVKLVLFPLQNKANQSMKRMSAISPQLTEVREKYKDDPARMSSETMKLYRANGMSPLGPLGGCLPMLIQMPIFFGFLYMLYTAAELRNSGFLWVHDLSQPDTVATVFGVPINVLPLMMIGMQFWQMRLTPRTGDPAQQKTMMFMPLLFGFFCYSFAAALALYYTMQGALTVLQLYLTRNQTVPTPATGSGGGGAAKFVPVRGGSSGGSFGGGKKGSPKRIKT